MLSKPSFLLPLALGLIVFAFASADALAGRTRPPRGGPPPRTGVKEPDTSGSETPGSDSTSGEKDDDKKDKRERGVEGLQDALFERLLDAQADAVFQSLFDAQSRAAAEAVWTARHSRGAGAGALDERRAGHDARRLSGDAKALLRDARDAASASGAGADERYLLARLLSGDAALHEHRRVLKADPAHVRSLVHVGSELLLRGDMQGAAAHLERAERLAPRDAAVLHAVACLRHREDRLDDAERLLREALRVESGFTAARVHAGILMLETGRGGDAMSLLTQAAAEAETDAYAEIALGRACWLLHLRAEESPAADAADDDSPGTVPDDAGGADERGKATPGAAIEHYRTAIALDAEGHSANLLLAHVLLRRSPVSEVSDLADDVLARRPADPMAHTLKVRFQLQRELPEAAYEAAHTFVAEDKSEPAAYLLRGFAMERRGKPSKAVKDLAKAVRLSGDDALFVEALGLAHRRAKRWKDAISAYRKVASITDDEPAAVVEFATVLRDAGKCKDALAVLERLVADAPDGTDGWLALARLCHTDIRRGHKRAAEAYLRYLDLGGSDPDVAGWLQEVTGGTK